MTSLEWLQKLRDMGCCVCGQDAVAHHMKAIGMGRNRKRLELAEHWMTVPLCTTHHNDYHQYGHTIFKSKHGVDLWKVLAQMLAKSICELMNGSE